MARPLPVNLLFAGTGAVLLVSGIGGESVGEVLKGQFGDVTGKKQAADTEGGGTTTDVSNTESTAESAGVGGGNDAPSPTTFSASTFAPSPTSFSSKQPSAQQQAKAIAKILLSEGIRNPTAKQIEIARARYQRETGVREYQSASEGAEEFDRGLPVT